MTDDAQAEYDSAFAQAAVKPPKVIDPNAPLPFIPSQRYVDKNLAPEQTLSYGDVGDLAEASRLAVKSGVLSKDVAQYMLPMAMVEGRPGNFGINDGNGFRAVPATLARAKALGLAYTDLTDPDTAERHRFDKTETDHATGEYRYYKRTMVRGPNGPMEADILSEGPPRTPLSIDWPVMMPKKPPNSATMTNAQLADLFTQAQIPQTPGNKHLMVNGSGAPGDMAKLMALILAEKHAGNKAGDAAGTVKAYNGAGPATEKYWAKVQAAKALLAHPRNAALMQHFNSIYLKKD